MFIALNVIFHVLFVDSCENLSAIVDISLGSFPANLISTHQVLPVGPKRIMPREDQKI